jgi:cell division control protein 6
MRSKIFADESKFMPDYVPNEVPFRDEQVNELLYHYRQVIEEPRRFSQLAFITGPVGSGKTLIAKKLSQLIEEQAVNSPKRIKAIYVNCRIDRTLYLVLARILMQLSPTLSFRGFSAQELMAVLPSVLLKEKMHLLLELDEVDGLVSKEGAEGLYPLVRLREAAEEQCLSLLLISKNLGYMVLMDRSVVSSLQGPVIKLKPYDAEQLYVILRLRAKEALNEGAVEDDSLKLAASIAADQGDARYALELLYRAGKVAEYEGKGAITPEHIRKARASMPPYLTREELYYLTEQERAILLALAKALKAKSRGEVSLTELEGVYREVCRSLGLVPLRHTRVWTLVNELKARGLVETRLSEKGARGRFTLVSTQIPVSLLQAELEGGLAARLRLP